MPLLKIDFQEGFHDDTIVININEKEVCRKEKLKTRLQTGFAGSCELDIPEGNVKIEAILPEKKISSSTLVNLTEKIYIGLSITPEGEIRYTIADKTFGYL